ncbi:MAG: hypothetical protein PF590_10835, partial [Candidatus Delongbacteria bacterium]|nr:hypothetical protein [Candidatus Delongbacteria bacterium]
IIAPTPFETTKQKRDSIWSDDFSSDKHLAFYEWDLNNPKPELEINEGQIAITSNHKGITFLGLRPQTGDYMLSSKVILSSEMSGIGVYSNEKNVLALTADKSNLLLFQLKGGEKEVLFSKKIEERESLYLKHEARDAQYFSFSWSENGTDWYPVMDDVDGTFIAQWGYSPRAGFIGEGKTGTLYNCSGLIIHYQY